MFCPGCGKEQSEQSKFCADCGAALPTSAKVGGTPPPPQKKKISGCVIAMIIAAAIGVVAIPVVGIVAAIAIPNLLNAIDRGKQKRTMADLRTVAMAVELFSVEHNEYPNATDIETLREQLEPDFASGSPLPTVDGWMQPLMVESGPQGYTIYSLGKDGIPDGCPGGTTGTFDADICFGNGQFTQWPEGLQR